MTLQLHINKDGHWFIDAELGGVTVGEAYKNPDGTWTVDGPDKEHIVSDLEAAKALFVERYDRSLVQLSPMSDDDGLTDPYSYIEEQNGRFIVIDPEEKVRACASEVEAVNLVKKLYPDEMFRFVGLDGEEGEDPEAGTTIIDLPWTPPQKPKKRRR